MQVLRVHSVQMLVKGTHYSELMFIGTDNQYRCQTQPNQKKSLRQPIVILLDRSGRNYNI